MDFVDKRKQLITWLKDTGRISPSCNETEQKVTELLGPQPSGRPPSDARKYPHETVAFFVKSYRETESAKVAADKTAQHFGTDSRTIWRVLKENKKLLEEFGYPLKD